MRILHVAFGLPPYGNGGLPLYVEGLVTAQEKNGDEPMVLEPGSLKGRAGIRKLRGTAHKVFRITPALPVAYLFGVNEPEPYMQPIKKEVYQKFLARIQPDVIHVHSLMGIHKEFFEVVKEKNIKIVMTTHDYFGLDLRAIFVDSDGRVYDDRDPRRTAERNYHLGASFRKQVILQAGLYKKMKDLAVLKKVRGMQRRKVANKTVNSEITGEIVSAYANLLKYYDEILKEIDYFVYNSTVAKNVYQKFVKSEGEILPLMLPGLRKTEHGRDMTRPVKIGFIGRIEKYKGVDILVDATRNMSGVEVLLYGDDFSEIAGGNIHNMGRFSRGELSKILQEIDLLIAPSVCYETFSLSVLEALMAGIPVLVSTRVGAKDLLKDSPIDVVFKPEASDLKVCLERATEGENYSKYVRWVEKLEFPTMGEHAEQVRQVYQKVTNQ